MAAFCSTAMLPPAEEPVPSLCISHQDLYLLVTRDQKARNGQKQELVPALSLFSCLQRTHRGDRGWSLASRDPFKLLLTECFINFYHENPTRENQGKNEFLGRNLPFLVTNWARAMWHSGTGYGLPTISVPFKIIHLSETWSIIY